jgi:hypothetical protein
MNKRVTLNNIVAGTIATLIIVGMAFSQACVGAVAANVDSGYEMRVHLDRTLSLTSSRVGDRFSATVADPGPFNLARISGHIESITTSGTFKGATEMYLSFDRIRLNDGEAYPINADIIRLYDVASGEQADAQLVIETRGRRRPQTLKRTGLGVLGGGIFGVAIATAHGTAAGRPRVVADGTTTAADGKDIILDQGVEMLLRVYPIDQPYRSSIRQTASTF